MTSAWIRRQTFWYKAKTQNILSKRKLCLLDQQLKLRKLCLLRHLISLHKECTFFFYNKHIWVVTKLNFQSRWMTSKRTNTNPCLFFFYVHQINHDLYHMISNLIQGLSLFCWSQSICLLFSKGWGRKLITPLSFIDHFNA